MSEANVLPNSLWQAAWPIVLAANLTVPLMFGLEVTRGGGRWGMGLAIALVWLVGHLACARFKVLGPRLVIGGVFVGLSQLSPVLQIMAGSASLDFVSWAGMTGGEFAGMPDRLTEFGGFLATFLTGGQLLFVAILCGFAVAFITTSIAPHNDAAPN